MMLRRCYCDVGWKKNRMTVEEDCCHSFTMINMQTCFGSGVRTIYIYTCFLCMQTNPNRFGSQLQGRNVLKMVVCAYELCILDFVVFTLHFVFSVTPLCTKKSVNITSLF